MYGVISVSTFGWVLGTFLGGAAGTLLPSNVTSALGIVLYGMFIAIVVPPVRRQKNILFVVGMAALFSVICKYLLPFISGGFAVILSAIIAAVCGALLFPQKDGENE